MNPAASPGRARPVLRLPDCDYPRLPGSQLVSRAVGATVVTGLVLLAVFIMGALLITLRVTVDGRGTLEPLRVSPVRSLVAGRIAEVRVGAGDTVQAGQIVARLDTLDASASAVQLLGQLDAMRLSVTRDETALSLDETRARDDVARAEAGILRARASLRERLAQYGMGTNVDSALQSYQRGTHVAIDLGVADVLTANADLRTAQTQRERSRLSSLDVERNRREVRRLEREWRIAQERRRRLDVRAPSRGVVLTEALEQLKGATVREGDAIMEVADVGGWRVMLSVTERNLHRIRSGDSVSLEIPALTSLGRDRLWGAVEHITAEPSASGSNGVGAASSGLATSGTAPSRYGVVVKLDVDPRDPLLPNALRRGYDVRGHIVTRSARAIVLMRDYFFARFRTAR